MIRNMLVSKQSFSSVFPFHVREARQGADTDSRAVPVNWLVHITYKQVWIAGFIKPRDFDDVSFADAVTAALS